MKKITIWIIIGVMSLALFGSGALQLYWINWSVQLHRTQFDQNVFSALNKVVEQLEEEENNEIYSYLDLDENEDFNNANIPAEYNTTATKKGITKEEFIAKIHEDQCMCSNCIREREYDNNKMILDIKRRQLAREFNFISIEERITNPANLQSLIYRELRNKGIDLAMNHAIWDNKTQRFVIEDGKFQVSMGKIAASTPLPNHSNETSQKKHLKNSKYQVELFTQGMSSPGSLYVYFPGLNRAVWKSAWKSILAAIVFTGCLLVCFVYTFQVIFRQKKLSEMKTDFINNMTHEFKTPIATISLASDSITSLMNLGKTDRVLRFTDIIKQENKRMLSQVEKVLQMAQIDKENFKLKIVDIDLNQLVNDAIVNASVQVAPKDGTVSADIQAQKAVIQGDMTHVSNVIHNLLDNANKYSPQKPEISVHTRNVRHGVQVIIKDKGIGMSKEARKHIFDKFYRVHTGNLHDVKGFGLGLSYVKAMMNAHQGQINVKSELGKGSSFTLFFPFKHEV